MVRKAGLGVVVLLTGAMLAAAPHSALHLELTKSEPAKGATLTQSPSAIQLWYSQEPQVKLTTVKLTGPAGELDLKPVTVVGEDGKHLSAPVPGALAPGAYTVAWRTLARDGHVVNGEFGFSIAAPAP